MASEAANRRCLCAASALSPAARTGSAGISQRFWTIQLMGSRKKINPAFLRCTQRGETQIPRLRQSDSPAPLSLHGIDLVQVRGLVVAIDRDDQRQPDGSFTRSNRNRKQHED